jgi:hypothetical protein
MFVSDVTPIGASFVTTSLSAGGSATLVAPATNVNGVFVRTLSIGAYSIIYAATSAPSTYEDSTKAALLWNAGTSGDSIQLPYPVLIPAGNGIYAIAATGKTPGIFITYDVI